tara:strand:+ start:252 stop:797 length:546 start_codon:yes stop_codon:yes gene_type:complete
VENKRRILITCPHVLKSGDCEEKNDPGAIESATELWKTLGDCGFHCTLLSGSVDRTACDLNREPCFLPFAQKLHELLLDHEVLFDIHSYRPRPGVFNDATGIVCLTPSEGKKHLEVLEGLKQSFSDLVVLKGGNNYIINKAAELGRAALLLEVPYTSCGKCCFEGDWNKIARVFERNVCYF